MKRYFVPAFVGVDAKTLKEARTLALGLARAVNKGTGYSDHSESLTIDTTAKVKSEKAE